EAIKPAHTPRHHPFTVSPLLSKRAISECTISISLRIKFFSSIIPVFPEIVVDVNNTFPGTLSHHDRRGTIVTPQVRQKTAALRDFASAKDRVGSNPVFEVMPAARPLYPGEFNRSVQHQLQSIGRGFEGQGLSRALIEPQSNAIEVGLGEAREIGSSREVLSQQAVGVLVAATLPWTARITEVNL